MKIGSRGGALWPSVLAVVFFSISILLAFSYPSSFWMVTDYEPLGLADALNMAYRLADLQMYEAVGVSYHPGVTFYLLSWLALALTGYPIASGENFLSTVLGHVEDYHRLILCLGALVGAAGVYVFARAAGILAPAGVTAAGVALWLFSTSATLNLFTSVGMDSFALLINVLFLAVLAPLAYAAAANPNTIDFAASSR